MHVCANLEDEYARIPFRLHCLISNENIAEAEKYLEGLGIEPHVLFAVLCQDGCEVDDR